LDFGGGTNFYDYVANDPTVFIDPFGLYRCVAGADCSNLNPELERSLICFDICTGRDTAVTSARRPPSRRFPHGSHQRGLACDIGGWRSLSVLSLFLRQSTMREYHYRTSYRSDKKAQHRVAYPLRFLQRVGSASCVLCRRT
jgi:hypothetical protein